MSFPFLFQYFLDPEHFIAKLGGCNKVKLFGGGLKKSIKKEMPPRHQVSKNSQSINLMWFILGVLLFSPLRIRGDVLANRDRGVR